MRKVSISALVFCLILGTAVVAMAKATTHTAKGPVVSVDPTANSFSVKEKAGNETFMVTATTKIEEHGKTIPLADVKSGQEVTVWYTMNAGKNEASKVLVHGVMKAKTTKPGRR